MRTVGQLDGVERIAKAGDGVIDYEKASGQAEKGVRAEALILEIKGRIVSYREPKLSKHTARRRVLYDLAELRDVETRKKVVGSRSSTCLPHS